MHHQYGTVQRKEQERGEGAQDVAQDRAQKLENFLLPLVQTLDTLGDKRLVRTLVQCCVAIKRFRNHKQGVWLSELGSYMDGYREKEVKATAGTKRLGNVLRSLKWSILQIDQFLLEKADEEGKTLKGEGKRIFCIWDGSVIEKPESEKIEGLCPVISSKAKGLHRSKKGMVFNPPPTKPITVTGMQWTSALLTGMEGLVSVAVMSWWSTRGEYAVKMREQEELLLRKCVRKWG